MKEFKRVFKVLAIRRVQDSIDPKWDIALQYVGGIFDDQYHAIIATTESHSACSYVFHAFSIKKYYEITYHFSNKAEAIITNAKEVQR